MVSEKVWMKVQPIFATPMPPITLMMALPTTRMRRQSEDLFFRRLPRNQVSMMEKTNPTPVVISDQRPMPSFHRLRAAPKTAYPYQLFTSPSIFCVAVIRGLLENDFTNVLRWRARTPSFDGWATMIIPTAVCEVV